MPWPFLKIYFQNKKIIYDSGIGTEDVQYNLNIMVRKKRNVYILCLRLLVNKK